MRIDVLDLSGKAVGSLELDDSVFGAEVKEHLLWEVVKAQRAAKRAGTHSTKRYSEVRGGGKKPWRQKGTGRARQGSIRAPQFVGGGSVFGPKPRSYEQDVPKKVVQSALRSALSLRAKENKLVVVRDLPLQPKSEARPELTKQLAGVLKTLGVDRALLVDGRANENLSRAAKNLVRSASKTKFLPIEGLNVYDVLDHHSLVLTQAAVEAITARLKRAPKEAK